MVFVTSQGVATIPIQSTAPTGVTIGALWQDTSTNPPTLKAYDGASWNTVGKTSFASSAVVSQSTTIGDYSTPTNAVSSSDANGSTSDNGKNAAHTTNFAGNVYAYLFSSLTVGALINSIGLKVSAAAGNVRVKAYADSAGAPAALLGQSGSIAVSGTGIVQFTLTTPFAVPSDGKVWAAFETDSNALDIFYTADSGGKNVAHTYGTGPDPFGTPSTVNSVNFILNFTSAYNLIDGNTATRWTSTQSTNPNAYVDLGSSLNMCAVAFYWDGVNTTETQITIQTSPDATTWTTKRTVTTSNLTTGAYNYYRFNIQTARYLRFYGNSGTSKVLSIYEVKVMTKTDAQILSDLGILEISTSSTSLSAAGT